MTDPERIRSLRWDDWNLEHITKHGMEPDDAAEVVWGGPMIEPSYEGRLMCLGPNAAGRVLAVIVGPVPNEPGAYYVFSTHLANRKERQI
jgi:uncharacterized DUF497 family protein